MGEADLDPQQAAQVVGAVDGGGQVYGLGFGDQGADPIGLGAGVQHRLQSGGDLADAGQGDDGGGDGGAARRLLHQAADLQLAVLGQFQGAGDGGGRHGQQVDGADARIALGLKSLALADAEPMLFVDDGQGQAVEADGVLEQGVGADGDLGVTGGQGGQLLAPLAVGVAAGEQDGDDAGRLQQGAELFVMLAGQDFGRGHQGGLEAAGGRVGQGQGGDGGLARTDVALKQPAHLFAGGQVAADFGDGLGLGVGQGEGQGLEQVVGGGAGGDDGRGLDLAGAATAGQGQLVGQEFVIGQALAGGGLGRQVGLARRGVQGVQRRAPAQPVLLLQPGGVLPFRQVGGGGQGGLDQFAQLARGQALGRRIDGFGSGDVGGLVGRDNVRVDDLDLAVEAFDLARDQPGLAARQQPVDMLGRAAEPDQVDEAGRVAGADLQRGAGAAGDEQAVDDDLEDPDLAVHGGRRLHGPADDDARGAEEGQVAHQRTRHLLHQGQDAGAHALQAGDLGEQGKENLRTHRREHSVTMTGGEVGEGALSALLPF